MNEVKTCREENCRGSNHQKQNENKQTPKEKKGKNKPLGESTGVKYSDAVFFGGEGHKHQQIKLYMLKLKTEANLETMATNNK